MSLPRFFAGAPEVGGMVVLEGDEARHAAGARRLRDGDMLESGDGEGAIATCVVEASDARRVVARVQERRVEPRPAPHVTVALAPPKGDRLTWGLQKLTELGVDRILLLETERTVRHPAGLERLRRVVREAAKQSGRPYLPPVDGPVPWTEALEAAPVGTLSCVLYEEADDGLLGLLPQERPARVLILVGPEGGLTQEEASGGAERDALLASLGPTLLRTETAAIVGASLVLARYGRLGR
ncbi:MAG TPA: RsmE family RNA methyltransferase [Actinomycetota bacterium]|nr:RsmE family RNA methyltransferase [Actinomycetota bacterium]